MKKLLILLSNLIVACSDGGNDFNQTEESIKNLSDNSSENDFNNPSTFDNVKRVVHSKVQSSIISKNADEVKTILNEVPHQTVYYERNNIQRLIIGPNDYLDIYGDRPLKLFKKIESEWVFVSEFNEIIDAGPRDYDFFKNGSIAFANHGLESPKREWPLGYLWKVSKTESDDLEFSQISGYKAFWHSIALGDLNRDKIEDVVSVQMRTTDGDNFPFHIFLGNQNGSFSKISSQDFFEKDQGIFFPSAGSINISDLDNDGNKDIILGAYGNHVYGSQEHHGELFGQKYGFQVYSDTNSNNRYEIIPYNIPFGSFEYLNMGSTKIEIEDLNGDNKDDLVVFFEGSIDSNNSSCMPSCDNYIDVFINNGDRSFSQSRIFAKNQTEISAREFELIDVDNDGDKDIALKSWQFSNEIILNQDMIISRDKNSNDGVIDFSNLIYINNNGLFNKLNRNLSFKVEELNRSYFIPIYSNGQFRYLRVSTPWDKDYIIISEYSFNL